MIRAKYIIKVSEDYFKSGVVRGKEVTLYENPGSSDLRELYKNKVREVRFLANAKTKNIYIWDSYIAIHDDIRRMLGLPTSRETTQSANPYIAEGYAAIVAGKLKFTEQKKFGTIAEIFSYLNDMFKTLGVQHRTMSVLQVGRQYKQIPDFGKAPDLYIQMTFAKNVIKGFLSQNWSFVERYVPGFNNLLSTIESKFNDWTIQYDN